MSLLPLSIQQLPQPGTKIARLDVAKAWKETAPSKPQLNHGRPGHGVALVTLYLARRKGRGKGHLQLLSASDVSVVSVPVEMDGDEEVEETELAKSQPRLQRFLPEGHASADVALLRFMEALEERGVKLYPAQEEAIVEIFSGAHVVLDTPTGSGKSLVAVAALFKALGEGGKAFYTSPTKALTSEKFFDLCRHFGAAAVGMATGDVSINTRAPLVCCTQEVLTSISLREDPSRPTLVVMDEFHYFADPDRGAAWELPLWRFSRPGWKTSFLLMSGTLGANDQLYETLQERSGRPVRVVSSNQRPVPLEFSYSEKSVADSIAELVFTKRAPVYVVHFSQREALETATAMADATDADGNAILSGALRDVQQLQQRVAATDFTSPFGAQLKELLLKGVGVHHAGLLPCYRRLVEQLTQDSLLALVCGTDTLGVGINVPIRSVLFTRLCKFDGDETRIMRAREFHQIAGRAGRKGFDVQGDVMAVDPEWVVSNRQLEKQIKDAAARGAARPAPRWRRPPRRNYKHWTSKTFSELQRSAPAPLASQFRLSMAQVLSIVEGARALDYQQTLDDLIAAAQCSVGAKRFWKREVKAYLAALGSYVKLDAGMEQNTVKVASIPLDDGTLFISEALPILQERLSEEDLPLVVLAAAEAVCDISESLRRALPTVADAGGHVPGRCPDDIETLLFEVFNRFREKRPWVSPNFLQPKGIALELLMCESYNELAERFGGPSITSEGSLLRYLSDVYRALRLGVPTEMKSKPLREVETRLRSTVLSVDSSLISEWEALKDLEENTSAVAVDEEGDEQLGGTMVPSASSTPKRSVQEIQQRLLQVQSQLANRHAQDEASNERRQKSFVGKVRKASRRIKTAAQELWQDLISIIW